MTMIREMRTEEKPREKFARSAVSVNMVELAAILLRTGTRGVSVMEAARQSVEKLEKAGTCGSLDWRDLTDIPGIGRDKAVTLCAAVELGRRLASRHAKIDMRDFGTPDQVADFFMENLRNEPQEQFHCVYLNLRNKFLGTQEISRGDLDTAPVDIRSVFMWGLRYRASGLILVHNHPSGYPEPSKEDIAVTRKFADAAKLLDMSLLDHIIIGDGIYTSLHERGCI